MKCITYVSRVVTRQNGAKIPTGLSEIYKASQHSNAQFGISGLLSYQQGYYIGIIEGVDAAVDQLFTNIRLDTRHEDVNLIFEFPIASRAFANWEMKMFRPVKDDPDFQRFIANQASRVSQLSFRQSQLLARFYHSISPPPRTTVDFAGKDLRLLKWPDFSKIKQSTVLIELCARLTKRPSAYTSLLQSGEFGSREALDAILNQLDELQVLQVSDSLTAQPEAKVNAGQLSFYSKMKEFLTRR